MTNETMTENIQTDEMEKKRFKLQQKILKYFQNKEIVKERNEENKLILEEIEEYFTSLPEEEVILQLANEEWAKLNNSFVIKEVLDKELLALDLGIDKAELKTPWDFSKLAENMLKQKGVDSRETFSKMISEHTHTETIKKLKLSKSKRKPKTKKQP